MTCKEKLMKDRPDLIEEYGIDVIVGDDCPQDYMDIIRPEYCCGEYCDECEKCWNREFMDPETVERIAEAFDNSNGYYMSAKELKEAIERSAEENTKSTILDSGDRTEFATGAVRDMREGKGRFDVMPMEVISTILNSPILEALAEFQLTGATTYLYHAIEQFTIECYSKDTETDTLTQLSSTMILEVAKHYEEGAIKYKPDNWRRGIPVWCYIDSATRHYIKWRRGDTDEHHERAFIWNLMCCIWEVDYGEEWRKQKGYFNAE